MSDENPAQPLQPTRTYAQVSQYTPGKSSSSGSLKGPSLHNNNNRVVGTSGDSDNKPAPQRQPSPVSNNNPGPTFAPMKPLQRSVVLCTPSISNSEVMQRYITSQTQAEKKQWVYDVLNGVREAENHLLNTPDFILLPDTETVNSKDVVNLLAIFKDVSLKSIRSLDGRHIELLRDCRDQCLEFITNRMGFDRTQILSFFHYLPSVFQLHVHFCAPYGQYTTLDICKIHPLDMVISNLEIDAEYYKKVSLTTVVIGRGELNSIYNRETDDIDGTSCTR